MNKQPRDPWEDALVAMGGPVLGSAGDSATAVAAHATNSQLLFALADFGIMINLFNIVPVGSMDGARVDSALSPYVGLAGYITYSGAIASPVFYLVLLAGRWETFSRFPDPHQLPQNYYRINPVQRAALTGSYFGLVVALAAAMDANQRYRKSPEILMREAAEGTHMGHALRGALPQCTASKSESQLSPMQKDARAERTETNEK